MSSEQFDALVKRWALKHILSESWGKTRIVAGRLTPEDITKVEVLVEEASGYCETCYTPGRAIVRLWFSDDTEYIQTSADEEDAISWATLLAELLEMEDEESE